MSSTDRGTEIIVRLRNRADRALHYIGDVRRVSYDSASRRLLVKLTEEVASPQLGAMTVHPVFKYIDPHSEAELSLKLPPRMIRLAAPNPDGSLAFEEDRPAEASEVIVEVGWADVPFYRDPRDGADAPQHGQPWMQGTLTMAFTIGGAVPKPSKKRRAT